MGWHESCRIRPAQGQTASGGRLQSIGGGAHPMIGIAQGDASEGRGAGDLHGAGHGLGRRQDAGAAIRIPLLQGAKGGDTGRLSGGVNTVGLDVAHEAGESVQAVRGTPSQVLSVKIVAVSRARSGVNPRDSRTRVKREIMSL